jgi:hypothetical protein
MKIALCLSLSLTCLGSALGDTPLLVWKTQTNPNHIQGTPQILMTCEVYSTKALITREVQDINLTTGVAVEPILKSTEERLLQVTGDFPTLIKSAMKGPHTNRNRGQDDYPDYVYFTAKTETGDDLTLEQWDTRSVYRNVSKDGIRLKMFLQVNCR